MKSAIILGVEIVLFIENVEEICFYKLADALDLDIYQFWKIVNPFLKHDLTVSSYILRHFQEIDVQLLSFMIFKRPSKTFKDEVEEFLINKNSYLEHDYKEVQNIEFHNQSLFIYHDKNINNTRSFEFIY